LLPQFSEKGKFNLDKFQAQRNNPNNLQNLFESKNAVYLNVIKLLVNLLVKAPVNVQKK